MRRFWQSLLIASPLIVAVAFVIFELHRLKSESRISESDLQLPRARASANDPTLKNAVAQLETTLNRAVSMSNAQEAQVTKQATNIQIRIDELQDWPKVQQQKLEIRTMLQSLEDVRRLQIGPVELARRLRPLLVPDEWVAMSVAQQEDFLEPFFDLPPEEREALYYRLLRAKDPTSPLLLDETEAKQQVLVLQQVLSEATHDVQRVKEVRSEAEQGLEQVRLAQAKLEQQQQLDRQMITILLTHIDRVNKETESRVRWEVVAAALVTGFFSCVAVALTVWSSRQTSRDQFRRDELDHQRRQDDRPGPRKSALFDADGEPIGRSR